MTHPFQTTETPSPRSGSSSIYLDYNATAPMWPDAVDAVCEAAQHVGNPSSLHQPGQASRRRLDAACEQMLRWLGAAVAGTDFVLTSGGTESDALAVVGLALALARREGAAPSPAGVAASAGASAPARDRVLVSAIEHPAVLATESALRRHGVQMQCVAVDRDGRLDLGALAAALDERVALVSVMLAHNETGVLQPVAEVVRLAHRVGALVHTDATQAAGKIPIDFDSLGVDAMSLSAHKFGGPRATGGLVLKRSAVRPVPLWGGGGQFDGMRPGTPAVALACGMAAAARASAAALGGLDTLAARRDAFERRLLACAGAFGLGASPVARLPNTAMVGFAGVPAGWLVRALSERGVMVSGGAACHSTAAQPSRALLAMGLDADRARQMVRFSLGWSTTEAQLEVAVAAVEQCLTQWQQVRAESCG